AGHVTAATPPPAHRRPGVVPGWARGRRSAVALETRFPGRATPHSTLRRLAGRVPADSHPPPGGSAERGAQLRERALLDLAHALGADTELVAEVAQRPWAGVGREAAGEDAPLAGSERRKELADTTDGVAPFGP